MKPRERVLAALNFREPDRVPIVLGASNATGLKMEVYEGVRRVAGLPREERPRFLHDFAALGTADPAEDALRAALHSDVRGVHDREPAWVRERAETLLQQSRPYADSWGSSLSVHPLADAQSAADVDAYAGWPDASDATRWEGVRARAKALADAGEFAVLGCPWLLFPLERAFAMQGMARFLENLAAAPDVAAAVLRHTLECSERLMERFLEECGEFLDIVKIGDDLGTQTSLLMSPAMYRRVLKPLHRELIAFIKRRTPHVRVFFHTDGDVFPLLGDFADIGVDILNPIQTSAGKMSDLARVKEVARCRGLALCGAIDTHRILPSGTPEEVAEEVHRVVSILSPGGGYLLSSVHTIMADVPPENVIAMVQAALGSQH